MMVDRPLAAERVHRRRRAERSNPAPSDGESKTFGFSRVVAIQMFGRGPIHRRSRSAEPRRRRRTPPSLSRAELIVRIQSPPATSLQTFGPYGELLYAAGPGSLVAAIA